VLFCWLEDVGEATEAVGGVSGAMGACLALLEERELQAAAKGRDRHKSAIEMPSAEEQEAIKEYRSRKSVEALRFAQSEESKAMVAEKMEQLRKSWREKSWQSTESFRSQLRTDPSSQYLISMTKSEKSKATERFKKFTVEILIERIRELKKNGQDISANSIVVALSKFLNEAMFAVVRNRDRQLTAIFASFEPHSVVCISYYLLDVCMALMEHMINDESMLKELKTQGKTLSNSFTKKLKTFLHEKLESFWEEEDYDPFLHVCEEATLKELQEVDAKGLLEPLFLIFAD